VPAAVRAALDAESAADNRVVAVAARPAPAQSALLAEPGQRNPRGPWPVA